MRHLSLEELARLLDEPPTRAEEEHLAGCVSCSSELDAFRGDLMALGELPDLLPPPEGAWDRLESRLHDEGLIHDAPPVVRWNPFARPALQLAAAIIIFILGGVGGFGLHLISQGEGTGGAIATATERVVEGAEVWDLDAAATALEEAETVYLDALAGYAEFLIDAGDADPMARLAVLENIVTTTRAALSTAPADPLINGYHLTALAQRDATVRQLALASNDHWY